MVLSSLLGADITLADMFFPIYTLEKLLFFPETSLMPLRKDGDFIWHNYFMNIYSILFSCWAHRHVLLLAQPDCDLKNILVNMLFYIYFCEMFSLAWSLAMMTPDYWGVLVLLFVMPIFLLVGGGLFFILLKDFELMEIEIKARKFLKKRA